MATFQNTYIKKLKMLEFLITLIRGDPGWGGSGVRFS